jgi:hypothetical protein
LSKATFRVSVTTQEGTIDSSSHYQQSLEAFRTHAPVLKRGDLC